MIKQVIIVADANTPPATELTESLISGGISFFVQDLSEAGPICAPAQDELVLLHEIGSEANLELLRSVIARANANWPGLPVIACRAARPCSRECVLDAQTLKKLGFCAVADNPAQLPALLRQIEDQSATGDFELQSDTRNAVNGIIVPALPRALRGERLPMSIPSSRIVPLSGFR